MMNNSFLFFYTTWINGSLLNESHDYEGIISSDTLKFASTLTGKFLLHVSDCVQNEIEGSPFEFSVMAGDAEKFKARWVDGTNTFKAGKTGTLEIHLTDQYSNPVENSADADSHSVIDAFVKPSTERPVIADLRVVSDKDNGQVNVSFLAISAGNYYLHVFKGNKSIEGSPFSFEVVSGTISTRNCRGYWLNERNLFEAGDLASLLVEFFDAFNNIVTLETEPLLLFQRNEIASNKTAYRVKHIELNPGYEIVTFYITIAGNSSLHVTDADNVAIFGSPFPFMVNPGSTDAKASVISGSGLNQAVAGEVTSFSVQLYNADGKPSVSYPGSVSVLFKKEGSDFPTSFKIMVAKAYLPFQENVEASASNKNVSIVAENSSGSFKVQYSISPGNYELYVLWTNIILNEGKPFSLAVLPGGVDVSRCQCYKNKYDTGSRVKAWNYINVLLKDGSGFEVYGKADLLSVSMSSKAGLFKIEGNIDNGNGSYVAAYMPMAVGEYKISVTYDGLAILSCSMTEYAHTEKYYPWAKSDNVRVKQDSVAIIDVLYNDTNGAGSLLLYNITQEPVHGTCVIYYHQILYVPVLGSMGIDTFMYAVQDENSNFGFGKVTIEIYAELPKIITSADTLKVLEDEPITFDGNNNVIKVLYGNDSSILTLNLHIEHGYLYQGAHASQLWFQETIFGTNILSFQGSLNVLNEFLQSFLYIGPENFNGENYLFISILDENESSVNKSIRLIIQPVNDPPYIFAPFKMILGSDGHIWHGFFKNNTPFANEEGSEFIRVGDPDVFDIKEAFGDEMQLEVSLKVEVGTLLLTLPRIVLDDMKYKQANDSWKQFDTAFLESHQEFWLVSVQAILFRSSINGSNAILQTLKYQGASTSTLSIIVNDLGSWGCSVDCISDIVSIPLSDSVTILLHHAGTSKGSLESRITLATSLAILAALATIVIFILLPCFILTFDEIKTTKHNRLKRTYDKISQNDESNYHGTRVYNPHWIPSTSGNEASYHLTSSNPLISRLWQTELKTFMILAKDKILTVLQRQ